MATLESQEPGSTEPGAVKAEAAVDRLLQRSRRCLCRLTAVDANAAMTRGGVLVDIRSEVQRRAGVVPGSIFIPRNVLEWRADPTSPYQDARLSSRTGPLILMCAEGYQSSLAAATLHALGVTDATDLIDGWDGWVAAGLPIESSRVGLP
jgi:rhodanese-related sulfurtransferase